MTAALPTPEAAPKGQGDEDLLLSNRATGGLQVVSRTYRPLPGTRAVTIRYRFGSYEVVTGRYYPDTVSVRLRSLTTGLEASEIGTVQSLAAHFNGATGVTAWRTRTIPVSDDGETIVVELAVANAIDLAHKSYILVDSVADVQYAIPTFELFEYKNVVSGATLLRRPGHRQGAVDRERRGRNAIHESPNSAGHDHEQKGPHVRFAVRSGRHSRRAGFEGLDLGTEGRGWEARRSP